jgi:hypothetical protein
VDLVTQSRTAVNGFRIEVWLYYGHKNTPVACESLLGFGGGRCVCS